MEISLNWLQDYVTVDMEASDLAYALTMAGLEVNAVYDRYKYLETVITGRIIDICKHPNADKLSLCRVDSGACIVDVVCGASNIKKNMMVPLALPGTVLPNGATIKKSVIRGKKSGLEVTDVVGVWSVISDVVGSKRDNLVRCGVIVCFCRG